MSDSDRTEGHTTSFPCPHCGADAWAVAGDDPQVLHALPPCEYFIATDGLTFVTEARKRAEAGKGRVS